MRKVVNGCCLVLLFFSSTNAQKNKIKYSKLFESYYISYWTFSLGLGTSAYRGDLCGRPECNKYKPAVNVGLNYKVLPHIAVGADFDYFQLQAKSKNRYNRDLVEFFTQGFDLRVYGRYFYYEDNYRTASDKIKLKRFNPYGQLGLSLLYYNTSSEITNVSDRPLRSEIKTYPAQTIGLPLSLGFSYSLSRRVSILAEGTYTMTLSDYLDDFGEARGNTNNRNDHYVLALLKLQFTPSAPSDGKEGKRKGKQPSQKEVKTKVVKVKSEKTTKTKTKKTKSKAKPAPRKVPSRKAPNRHPD